MLNEDSTRNDKIDSKQVKENYINDGSYYNSLQNVIELLNIDIDYSRIYFQKISWNKRISITFIQILTTKFKQKKEKVFFR